MHAADPSAAYTATASCTAPASAPPEDCIGSITVCSNTAITNNSTSAGCTQDLNATNHGCLDAVESQGAWYTFSLSSGGTLGLTIDPDGPDDYDWAIWGPYPPGSTTSSICQPAGAPIRCAASSGMATFNSTGSYNTGMGSPTFSSPQFNTPYTSYGLPATTDICPLTPPQYCGWVPGIQVSAGQVYLLYVTNWSGTSTGFNLNWMLGGGASLDCTVLPVELLSLEAEAHDPVIHVTWATATETHSDHFVVERSPDNAVFSPIGTVPAAGNSQFRHDYHFVDQQPYRGLNYYRLEQVDANGAATRSNTVVAFLSQGFAVALYPNPASEVLHVSFASPLAQDARLDVLDALGRKVGVNIVATKGQGSASIPLVDLACGCYQLRITLADGSILPSGSFVKQ
jgi:hypothetical protein